MFFFTDVKGRAGSCNSETEADDFGLEDLSYECILCDDVRFSELDDLTRHMKLQHSHHPSSACSDVDDDRQISFIKNESNRIASKDDAAELNASKDSSKKLSQATVKARRKVRERKRRKEADGETVTSVLRENKSRNLKTCHGKESVFTCYLCWNKRFKTSKALQRHIKRKHFEPSASSKRINRKHFESSASSKHVNRKHFEPSASSKHINRKHFEPSASSKHINRKHFEPSASGKHINRKHFEPSGSSKQTKSQNTKSNKTSKPKQSQTKKAKTKNCLICYESMTSQEAHFEHFLSKHVNKSTCDLGLSVAMFRCDVCEKVVSVDDVEEHAFTHSNRSAWECLRCNCIFNSRARALLHRDRHKRAATQPHAAHEEEHFDASHWMVTSGHIKMAESALSLENYDCVPCAESFDDRCEFEEHFKKHLSPHESTQFACASCANFSTCDVDVLKAHAREKHCQSVKHACELCGKFFLSQSSVTCHQRLVHAKGENETCRFCALSIPTQQIFSHSFACNVRNAIFSQLRLTDADTPTSSLTCYICYAVKSSLGSMLLHCKKHFTEANPRAASAGEESMSSEDVESCAGFCSHCCLPFPSQAEFTQHFFASHCENGDEEETSSPVDRHLPPPTNTVKTS